MWVCPFSILICKFPCDIWLKSHAVTSVLKRCIFLLEIAKNWQKLTGNRSHLEKGKFDRKAKSVIEIGYYNK